MEKSSQTSTPEVTSPLPGSTQPELPPAPSSIDFSEQTPPSTTSPEPFNPGWRFVAAFLSLCIIVLMTALDATSLSVALPVRTYLTPTTYVHPR
jgi:hypothetical protein